MRMTIMVYRLFSVSLSYVNLFILLRKVFDDWVSSLYICPLSYILCKLVYI